MSSASRIVTVIRATGTQGGAVVNALLADGTFAPRAITRDDTSSSAQALKSKGAEVAKADPENVDTLRDAIHGSEAVFLVTVPFIEQTELDQAQKVIQACKDVGVKFIVFSSLPNVTKETGGKYTKATFFDMKAEIEENLEASGIPYSALYTGHFLENAWKYQFLKSSTDHPGELDYFLPMSTAETLIPFTWVEKDIGGSALALFKNYQTRPADVHGGKFHVLTERATAAEYCDALARTLGRKVNYVLATKTGNEAMDCANEAHQEFGFFPNIIVPDPKLMDLGVKFGSLEEFLKVNKEKLDEAIRK